MNHRHVEFEFFRLVSCACNPFKAGEERNPIESDTAHRLVGTPLKRILQGQIADHMAQKLQ